MLMIYLHTKFLTPTFTRSLVIATKLKGKYKYRFRAVAILFYMSYTFFKHQGPTINGASVIPASEVCMAAMLVFLKI
jgi:hypothetical protein